MDDIREVLELPEMEEEAPRPLIDEDGNPMLDAEGQSPEDEIISKDTTTEVSEEPKIQRIGRCSTFMNLINALVGAGVVSVPYTFTNCGIGPTYILLIITCTLCYASAATIVRIQGRVKCGGLDDMAFKIFGKTGQVIVSILCMIFSITCTISYLIIGTGKLVDWLSLTPLNMKGTWPWAITALAYLICIPGALTIPRHLSFLSKFSYVSMGCIMFYAISIIIKSATVINKGGIEPTVIGYKFGTGIFNAFSIHALTFSLPIIMMPVIAPYNPSVTKRQIVLGATFLFSWFVISVPGSLAYMMKGDSTQSDILSSFAKDDILIIIVQVAMFLNVTCSYPVVCMTIVGSLGQFAFGQSVPELMTTKQRIILIPIVNAINGLIAMFLNNIAPILGIGGALGGCLVVFAFPSLAYLKTRKKPLYYWRNVLFILFFLFGIFSACICTYYSVLDAINSFK